MEAEDKKIGGVLAIGAALVALFFIATKAFASGITITATATAGGKISPSGVIKIQKGQTYIFTIIPDSGYVISDVIVDGISIGKYTGWTFHNVLMSHTIKAVFTKT